MKDNARDTGDAAQAAPFLLSADHRRRNGGGIRYGKQAAGDMEDHTGEAQRHSRKNFSRGKKKLQ